MDERRQWKDNTKMSTQPLSLVSSQPLPKQSDELSIVDSKPLPQSSKDGVEFLKDTASQTAHKMNVENILGAISDADSKAGNGDYSGAFQSLRGLVPHPIDAIKNMYQQVKSGNWSGHAADATSDALMLGMGAEGATGGVSNAISDLGDSAANTATNIGNASKPIIKGVAQGAVVASKNLGAHATAGAASLVPGVGHAAAVGIEGGNYLYNMSKSVKSALADSATAARDNALVEASRANPRTNLADQAGTVPTSTEPQSPVQPIVPAYATNRASTPAGPPAPEPTPMPQVTAPVAPSAPAARVPLWQQNLPPKATEPPQVSNDLLDGVAQWAIKKPFAKATAAEKVQVQALASKLTPAPSPAAPTSSSVPSMYQEAFEGDKGGVLSPQETQNRLNVANHFAPLLLKEGIAPEELSTPEGRLAAAQIAKDHPEISSNKSFRNSLKNYDPSDTTVSQVQTLMAQWDKYAGMMGYKSLADIVKKHVSEVSGEK